MSAITIQMTPAQLRTIQAALQLMVDAGYIETRDDDLDVEGALPANLVGLCKDTLANTSPEMVYGWAI